MKANEVHDLTDEELQDKLEDATRELFNLRIQQASGQLEVPSRVRLLRRGVAKIKTEQQQRKLAAAK